MGVLGWGLVVEGGGGESEGWSGPPSLLLQLQSVSDQLLIHSSFPKTTNRGHTRADTGQEVGRDPSLLSSPFGLTLLLQKQSSPSLVCFPPFLLLSLVDFIHLLSIIFPLSLFNPAPLTCFSGTNQQLSQQVHQLQNRPLFCNCSHSSCCCCCCCWHQIQW